MPLTFRSEHTIVIPQGATWRELFIYAQDANPVYDTDGVTVIDYDPVDSIDLSSYTPIGKVRARKNIASQLFAIIRFDMSQANDGKVWAYLTGDDTTAIPGNGYYDIALVGSDTPPNIIRLAQGMATLDRSVSL